MKYWINAASLPPRERGLKPSTAGRIPRPSKVAPPAGAWIETIYDYIDSLTSLVAPPAGAWIETVSHTWNPIKGKSLPPRERGLKPMRLPGR